MKKNTILVLASFVGVIVFALLWNLLTGAASAVFCALTLVCGAAFVWGVQKLSASPDRTAPEHADHNIHGRAA